MAEDELSEGEDDEWFVTPIGGTDFEEADERIDRLLIRGQFGFVWREEAHVTREIFERRRSLVQHLPDKT